MISKKTKAITAGILTAAMSASAVMPAFSASAANSFATENGANESFAKMFESLYDDVITNGQKNGYLSKNTNGASFGIPYHGVETLIVEAPDYGHESTSEAMSYITWICAMHDVLASKNLISSTSKDLEKAWKTTEALIPGWSTEAYGYGDVEYDTFWDIASGKVGDKGIKADALSECPQPQDYPDKQEKGGDAFNPIAKDMASAYSGTDGYYLMHWLADVDDWYGFGGGTPGAG
ncbi:MAG TPA: cellulose 1,4-beta-cellobiosidase, partial [Ruminococcus sp.]|nr:cellulose 1,4-beta-cellobiosidase [Ruminococcus sp.]